MTDIPFRPFEGEYEKQIYEVRLPCGETLLCWPNAGKMVALDNSDRDWTTNVEYRETSRHPLSELKKKQRVHRKK